MKCFYYFLVLLSVQSCFVQSASSFRIVPFCFQKHITMFGKCALQHFAELYPADQDSVFNGLIGYHESRLHNSAMLKSLHGIEQAEKLNTLCNKYGNIKNEDGSITKVSVLEVEEEPIGYIIFSRFFPVSSLGIIHQLAILDEYQRKGFGRELMFHALTAFAREPLIRNALMITQDKKVGENFLGGLLGFVQYEDDQKFSALHKKYYWVLALKN